MRSQEALVSQSKISEVVDMGRVAVEPVKSTGAVDRIKRLLSLNHQTRCNLEDVTRGTQSFEALVLPWFRLSFLFFVIPDYISFDPTGGQYRRVKGCLPRKILIGLVVVGVLVDQLWACIKMINHDGCETLLGLLNAVKCVVYFCFAASVCHLVIFRVEAMCRILTSIREEALHYAEAMFLIKLTLLSYVLTALYLLKAIHYSVFVRLVGRIQDQRSLPELLIGLGKGFLAMYTDMNPGPPNSTLEGNFATDVPAPLLASLGIFFVAVCNGVALCWTLPYGLMSLWAVIFWLLFRAFVTAAQGDVSKSKTTDIIRKFQRLTALLDEFNRTCGWVTFFCIASGICHFSIDLIMMQYRDDYSDNVSEVQATVGNTAMVIIYVIHLAVSAQVSYTAISTVDTFKSRYQDKSAWMKSCENCDDLSQGLALVLNDINSNRVGIQGGPFFTLTYAFAGTVLSIITTYAVLVKETTGSDWK